MLSVKLRSGEIYTETIREFLFDQFHVTFNQYLHWLLTLVTSVKQ